MILMKTEIFLCVLAIHLHSNGIWGLKKCTFSKTGFKKKFLKPKLLLSLCKTVTEYTVASEN